MKICVVAPAAVPYTRGGFERLWSGFVNHINDHTNHQAELVKLPFREETLHGVIDGYRRFAPLDLSGFDMILSSKYPGWMVAHPNHHVYMAHVLRGLYDTYPETLPTRLTDPNVLDLARRLQRVGNQRSDVDIVFGIYDEFVARLGRDNPIFSHPGPLGRMLVHALDRIGLATSAIQRHLAIAQTVADRPGYFPSDAVVGVIHPPTDLSLFSGSGDGDYLFTASRLDAPKRIDMLIDAFSRTDTAVEFRIAGNGPQADALRARAANDSRIVFLDFVPDEELPALYANAIAVPFIPQNEDYGLITLEAMQSATPVITTTDAGGPTELVKHDANGWVVDPTIGALSAAMAEACAEPARSRALGQVGQRSVAHITWPEVTRRLVRRSPSMKVHRVDSNTSNASRRPGRRRLVALNTFTAHNPQAGGQLRAFHLGRGLAQRFDVHLLSLAESPVSSWTVTSSPGFTETAIPRSHSHAAYEVEMGTKIGIPVGDIYGGLGLHLTPEYGERLRQVADDADAIILSHPYMEPALDLAGIDLPVIYDAYNVEARLKDSMFPLSIEADEAVREVQKLEAATLSRASLVASCSTEDQKMFTAVYGETPPVAVVPNGADIDAVPFVGGAARIAKRARWLHSIGADPDQRIGVFLASWHQPNLDAADRLHDMAADIPQMLFVMVGSHCNYFRSTAVPSNVIKLGLIGASTKRVLLAVADIGLNPMETGSGTNLKMVEYLASGMVALTTSVGARGLPDGDGIYHEAELPDFADAIQSIIEIDHDDETRVQQAERARRLVEVNFGWPQIAARFSDAIEDTVF